MKLRLLILSAGLAFTILASVLYTQAVNLPLTFGVYLMVTFVVVAIPASLWGIVRCLGTEPTNKSRDASPIGDPDDRKL